MKLTGRTMMKYSLAMEDRIAALKDCGYDGIELCFVDESFQFISDFTKKEYADYILSCCKKHEITIESVSFHCGYIFDDVKYEQLKLAIKAAPLYGVKTLITSNSGKRWECDQDADWDIFIERTRVLVGLAEEADIILAMEFEPGMVCGTTAELHKMFDAVPSDHLMANLDLGHVFLCDPDPIAAILSLKGKVAHAHIENMLRGVHRHLPPHLGDMYLPDYINALKDIEFDGAMAFDLYGFGYIKESKKAVPMIKGMF
ncbi:MAG: sugar phosphate isomerase/epimerase family protein [Lachnospiraceae bacterium]